MNFKVIRDTRVDIPNLSYLYKTENSDLIPPILKAPTWHFSRMILQRIARRTLHKPKQIKASDPYVNSCHSNL